MENFENIPQEPIPEEPIAEEVVVESSVEEAPVSAAPAKQSPFADSPYVMEDPIESAPVKEKPRKKKTNFKALRSFILVVMTIALVVGSCAATAYIVTSHFEQQNLQIAKAIRSMQNQIELLEKKVESNSFTGNGNSVSGTPTPAEGLTPGQIHAQNKDSVVGIANQGVSTNIFGQVTETASSGSGFIVSEDGYIVTNHHVIEGAKTLTVITNNEEEYPATVVGFDENNDFALIKIDATGLTPVKIGSSDDLIVGDQVVAIGNPLVPHLQYHKQEFL